MDEFGFTLVDVNRIGHRLNPFIKILQAKQVFYVKDQLDSRWPIVCHVSSKGEYIDGKLDNKMAYEPFSKELLPIDLYDTGDNDVNFA